MNDPPPDSERLRWPYVDEGRTVARVSFLMRGAVVRASRELTRYEVGPSVGAHTGAGTVGAVWASTAPYKNPDRAPQP